MWFVRTRRPVQWAVLVFFVVLPWVAAQGFTFATGNLFALDVLGLPFADPLAALQVLAARVAPGLRLAVGALCVLLLAVVAGRVFCSFCCPYGLLSELVHEARHRARRHGPFPGPYGGNGGVFRAGVVVVGLALVVLVGAPVLNRLSMPGEITLLLLSPVHPAPDAAYAPWSGLVLVLAVLAVEAVTGRRLWCRYLCPQSVLLSLAARLWPSGPGLSRDMKRCTCAPGDRACGKACSLGLDPRIPGSASRGECTHCGACVAACARRGGALSLFSCSAPRPARRAGAHAKDS